MIGWRELLILLVIVLLIFGAKRLRNIGEDLGGAVKGFKKGMHDDERPPQQLRDQTREDASGEKSAQRDDERTPR